MESQCLLMDLFIYLFICLFIFAGFACDGEALGGFMAQGINEECLLRATAVGQAPAGSPTLSASFCHSSPGIKAVDKPYSHHFSSSGHC